MDNKQKHLEMIQNVINRMANNSFLLKGWSITLVAALLALTVSTQEKVVLIYISFLPVIVFWILDSYYLWQERLFRQVYDHVRSKEEDSIDFLMNPMHFSDGQNTWISAFFSKTILIFYFSLVVTMTTLIVFIG